MTTRATSSALGDPRDRRGPAIEPLEEDLARLVVGGVIRSDDFAPELTLQVGDRDFLC